MRGRQNCRNNALVPSYLHGELSDREKARFEAHLKECDSCRGELDAVRRVSERLKELPAEELKRDLAPAIMAKIPQESWGRHGFNWALAAGLAACLALAVLGGLLLFHRGEQDTQVPAYVARESKAVKQALVWLAGFQEPDGSWDAKKSGGHKDYTLGLTGLAVLALLSGDEKPLEGAHAASISRGLEYIVAQQQPDGRFGPLVAGAMYNHGISTVALLEAYGLNRDETLKRPIDRALGYIYAQQKDSGGWGYRKGRSPANTSISIWQLHALTLACAVGWGEAGEKAGLGMDWLRGVIDEKGKVGYKEAGDFPYGTEALTAMGASCLFTGGTEAAVIELGPGLKHVASTQGDEIDFYRWYFLTYALHAVEEIRSGTLEARLQSALADQQVKSGPEAGSWAPTDQWGSAGGRVYSTSLAVLSLETARRVPRILGWIENVQ